MLNNGNYVGSVTTASAFRMVSVDCSILKGLHRHFNEAGFVQRVRVNEALDVVIVTNPKYSQSVLRLRTPIIQILH